MRILIVYFMNIRCAQNKCHKFSSYFFVLQCIYRIMSVGFVYVSLVSNKGNDMISECMCGELLQRYYSGGL